MLFSIACFQPHDEAAIFVPQTIENNCFIVLLESNVEYAVTSGKNQENQFSDSFFRPKKSASLLREGLWSMMMK